MGFVGTIFVRVFGCMYSLLGSLLVSGTSLCIEMYFGRKVMLHTNVFIGLEVPRAMYNHILLLSFI